MAHLKSRTLFFVTSPRSPMKMIPEIDILVQGFSGRRWTKNNQLQVEFMETLSEDPRFEGSGSQGDLAFSARDRITRGPKAYGFVDLEPEIALTDAGRAFLDEDMAEEALLRQLLKFQLPSPYHKEPARFAGTFFVRPYLELFRLIYDLGSLSFDELQLFGMQLTHYEKYDIIVQKILEFRRRKEEHRGQYRQFKAQCLEAEVREIYSEELDTGETRTRESRDTSASNFIKTKSSNLRDYADACFRYLRATGLISISQRGRSLSIVPEKTDEVRFFLENENRAPIFIDNETEYKEYLFNSELPVLYTDNRENLRTALTALGVTDVDYDAATVLELKRLLRNKLRENRERLIEEQAERIRTYVDYVDIMDVFSGIETNSFYDTPLMFEWNTWRAMTMLDDGNITANLRFDDAGQPLSTAAGNQADIVCDYGDFALSVEVTMQIGQRQYESESEPVSRHLGKLKRDSGKEAYCLFIAPQINDSCIAHFYMLHLTNIDYYGGTSVILPLELEVFEEMVRQSREAGFVPGSNRIKALCEYSRETARNASNETEWYERIRDKALNWLAV